MRNGSWKTLNELKLSVDIIVRWPFLRIGGQVKLEMLGWLAIWTQQQVLCNNERWSSDIAVGRFREVEAGSGEDKVERGEASGRYCRRKRIEWNGIQEKRIGGRKRTSCKQVEERWREEKNFGKVEEDEDNQKGQMPTTSNRIALEKRTRKSKKTIDSSVCPIC